MDNERRWHLGVRAAGALAVVLALAGVMLVTVPSGEQADSPVTVSGGTTDEALLIEDLRDFDAWLEDRNGDGAQAARRRAESLRLLAETDPSRALMHAVSPRVKASLPGDVAEHVEDWIHGEATMEVRPGGRRWAIPCCVFFCPVLLSFCDWISGFCLSRRPAGLGTVPCDSPGRPSPSLSIGRRRKGRVKPPRAPGSGSCRRRLVFQILIFVLACVSNFLFFLTLVVAPPATHRRTGPLSVPVHAGRGAWRRAD